MKQPYQKIEVEFIRLEEDVITTSNQSSIYQKQKDETEMDVFD